MTFAYILSLFVSLHTLYFNNINRNKTFTSICSVNSLIKLKSFIFNNKLIKHES